MKDTPAARQPPLATNELETERFSPYEDLSEYETEQQYATEQPDHPPRTQEPEKRQTSRAIVVHTLPTRYRVGELHRWLEEDNQNVEIVGAR